MNKYLPRASILNMGDISVDYCRSGAMQSYGYWWTLKTILRSVPRLIELIWAEWHLLKTLVYAKKGSDQEI